MEYCAVTPPTAGFAQGILSFVDCQARTLGAYGYQALADPGSQVSLALTGLLVLFVALIGYRMLLGRLPGVEDGVVSLIRIGVVLSLATAWPAYRPLVYDVVILGPGDLVSAVGMPAGIPGAEGGLATRLDNADALLDRLAVLGAGDTGQVQTQPFPGQTLRTDTGAASFTGFDGFAIGAARFLFLTGALGAFAALRLLAGVLLAFGPLVVAFLLFDATRGIVMGWIRVLAAAALGGAATALVLGIELALLEPWLPNLIAQRYAGTAIPGVPVQLMAAAGVFDLVLLVVMAGTARVAFGLQWPLMPYVQNTAARFDLRSRTGAQHVHAAIPAESRSRAATVADAIATIQRRETTAEASRIAIAGGARPAAAARDAGTTPRTAPPIGQTARRRTVMRASGSARRRDGGA